MLDCWTVQGETNDKTTVQIYFSLIFGHRRRVTAVTSDLSSDRSTWTCRCPSSSTRPPARTPTAPARQETTRCSPTTRLPMSPACPNSWPATEPLGHRTGCCGGGPPSVTTVTWSSAKTRPLSKRVIGGSTLKDYFDFKRGSSRNENSIFVLRPVFCYRTYVWWNHSVPTGKILPWVGVWNGSRRSEKRALIDWWGSGLWCSTRGPSASSHTELLNIHKTPGRPSKIRFGFASTYFLRRFRAFNKNTAVWRMFSIYPESDLL